MSLIRRPGCAVLVVLLWSTGAVATPDVPAEAYAEGAIDRGEVRVGLAKTHGPWSHPSQLDRLFLRPFVRCG